jgi:putative oxidoreductase
LPQKPELKTMFKQLLSTTQDHIVALLRVVLGVIFFAHGAQLLLGWFGGYGYVATIGFFTQKMGIPAPLAFLAIISQFFGGLALIVGLFARPAALGIALDMLVAIYTVHLPIGFFMNWSGAQKGEGFEYHLLATAIALAIVVKGAGAWSADHLLSRGESAQYGRQSDGVSPAR